MPLGHTWNANMLRRLLHTQPRPSVFVLASPGSSLLDVAPIVRLPTENITDRTFVFQGI